DPVSTLRLATTRRGSLAMHLPSRLEHLRDQGAVPGLRLPVDGDNVPELRQVLAARGLVREGGLRALSSQAHLEFTSRIAGPPEVVFDLVADLPKRPASAAQ